MGRNVLIFVVTGLLAGCGSNPVTIYAPNAVKLDTRTAQEEVRVLFTGAHSARLDGVDVKIIDVKFRPDGMAVLMQDENGKEFTRPCYYGGMDDLHVTKDNGSQDLYGAGYWCTSTSGFAWFYTEQKARRLVEALFALKNSRR